MAKTGRRGQDGFALVAILIMMTLLLGMGAAMHQGIMADTSLRSAHQVSTMGFYAAEAGVNRGMGDYRNIFQSLNVPTQSDFNLRSFSLGPRLVTYQLTPVAAYQNGVVVTVPGGRQYAGLNATEYRYTTSSRSELRTGDTESTLGTQFNVDFIALFQFLAFYEGDLEILPGPVMNLHGPIHTNGNLYLSSGNTLAVADCYPATCPTPIRTVHMSTALDVYRGRKDTSNPAAMCGGIVRISKLSDTNNDGLLDTRDMSCVAANQTTKQTTAQLSQWLGAITARVPRVSVPTPDDFIYRSGRNWNQADLRIVLDLDHPDANGRYAIIVEDQTGNLDGAKTNILQQFMNAKPGRIFYNDVPKGAAYDRATACGAADSYCNPANYARPFASAAKVYPCAGSDDNIPPQSGCANGYFVNGDDVLSSGTLLSSGSLTARRGGFYNWRERAWVRMLNVNVHDLLWWNLAQSVGNQLFDPNDQTDGGLVLFLTVRGPSSAGIPAAADPPIRYGVRVFSTNHLDFPPQPTNPTGLTVTSDQAIYIEGDYNVGIAGAAKKPASFQGDTINILSAAWSGTGSTKNDYQSRQSLTAAERRAGTNTGVYAAFIGGVDTTVGAAYNGGFENYPRFHEDWTSTLTYRGSYVNLGTPRHNNGAWCNTGGSSTATTVTGCNIYNPPARNWDFDSDFQNVANLPPLTPNAVGVEQILFTQSFR